MEYQNWWNEGATDSIPVRRLAKNFPSRCVWGWNPRPLNAVVTVPAAPVETKGGDGMRASGGFGKRPYAVDREAQGNGRAAEGVRQPPATKEPNGCPRKAAAPTWWIVRCGTSDRRPCRAAYDCFRSSLRTTLAIRSSPAGERRTSRTVVCRSS